MKKKPAYGGVVVRADGKVLLREPRGHFGGYAWTFPKGRPDAGESGTEAALREVLEETGYRAEIVCEVPGRYEGFETETFYYLMSACEKVQDPDPFETQSVVWVTFDEARELIGQTPYQVGRERDLEVLRVAEQLVRSKEAAPSADPRREHS